MPVEGMGPRCRPDSQAAHTEDNGNSRTTHEFQELVHIWGEGEGGYEQCTITVTALVHSTYRMA